MKTKPFALMNERKCLKKWFAHAEKSHALAVHTVSLFAALLNMLNRTGLTLSDITGHYKKTSMLLRAVLVWVLYNNVR